MRRQLLGCRLLARDVRGGWVGTATVRQAKSDLRLDRAVATAGDVDTLGADVGDQTIDVFLDTRGDDDRTGDRSELDLLGERSSGAVGTLGRQPV